MTSFYCEDAEKTWHSLSAVPPVLSELTIDELEDLDVAEIYKGTYPPNSFQLPRTVTSKNNKTSQHRNTLMNYKAK